ncbi:MAG TPA: hypothetical protein VFI99_13610, partial [Nocardioides sp.]|nr:hypothetical protein [Nocardioides sp.]
SVASFVAAFIDIRCPKTAASNGRARLASGLVAGSLTHLTVLDGGRERGGVVRPDESWAAAARRTAPNVTGHLGPLDLSGEIKRFQIDHDLRVSLRAMMRGDLPDVARWWSWERVRTWFDTDGEPDITTVTARYGPRLDGIAPTRMWVVEVNDRAAGFCQGYRVRDYPEYAVLTPDPDAGRWTTRSATSGSPIVGSAPGCCGCGWPVRAGGSPTSGRTSPRPTTATEPRSGSWKRWASSVEPGSTSRAGTGSVSTHVGCTLDVGAVIG